MSVNSAPILIDSHVHTNDERLQADLQAVLAGARAQNIAAQVIPATSRASWPDIKALCNEHEDLHACYGLHPGFFSEHRDEDIKMLPLWLARESAVAVGECGLDYAVAGADKSQQQHLFSAQLALAREFDLPIVIHAVRAVEDVIRMIRASGHYQGMVHSYSGSKQQAHRLIDLGYHLSFGGAMTYPRAKRLRELVRELPLDALLLETDAPDQPAHVVAGSRNVPANLSYVWETISEIRQEDAISIAQATTHNAQRLFKLPVMTPA